MLARRHVAAVEGHKEALKDLNELKSTLSLEEMATWDAMAAQAQIDRIEDPVAMDIYDTQAVLRKQHAFLTPKHMLNAGISAGASGNAACPR